MLTSAAGLCAQQLSYTAIDLGGFLGVSINNSGQAVGWLYSGNFVLSYLYSGTLPSLLLPGLDGGPQTDVDALAINAKGQIVGNAVDSTEFGQVFQYQGGSMIGLGAPPGSTGAIAYAINDRGQVAGYADFGNVAEHAFLYSGSVMFDLGTLPGGRSSQAFGINNNGQVVGDSDYGSGPYYHAFLSNGGTMIDLGAFPGGKDSVANAINNGGQIAGWADNGSITHAFLYSHGVMTDLGSLGGPNYESYAWGMNNLGQVVGQSVPPPGEGKAFLYTGGAMLDLNNYVTLPNGAYLTQARAINDLGQILAYSNTLHTYLLTPGNGLLSVVNPFALYAPLREAPPALDVPTVLSAPAATSVAADGESAVVLVYSSTSSAPVTFSYSSQGTPGGSLGPFDPNYLSNPSPVTSGAQSYLATTPAYGPDASGQYVFLALLWGPAAMPVPGDPVESLTVTATQSGQTIPTAAPLFVEPPPLLLIHGIWSSAQQAGFAPGAKGFNDWIAAQYPHQLIYPVDYQPLNSQAYYNSGIQAILLSSMLDGLAGAAAAGMAARTVDVVAHSMGGLITRYLMSSPSSLSPILLPNPVHDLITIGTPHLGSKVATALQTNKGNPPLLLLQSYPQYAAVCQPPNCSLGSLLQFQGMPVGGGIFSLQDSFTPPPQIYPLSPNTPFRAIIGDATGGHTATELILDTLIEIFVPGDTVANILGEDNDTIVGVSSQNPNLPGQLDFAVIPGNIVHTSLFSTDIGETASQAAWAQAYYWLTGGAGAVQAGASNALPKPRTSATTPPPPVLNLAGYTQVATSNIAFSPASGSTLTINTAAAITATSPKTITEVLLNQTVTDPVDLPLLAATESPFTISYTPTRPGTATFNAVAVFSDNTYAVTTLAYTLQPNGTPYSLTLANAPVANMALGDARIVGADANFSNGPLDVTQAAAYAARSGSANVFGIGAGGAIAANGNGVDLLDVSYGGFTATAEIAVGACTYALSPSNQIVPNTGGTVAIQVTTQPGCSWTAGGGAAWLPFAQAGGSGSGSILLTAPPNSAGGTEAALITLAGQQAIVTQPSTACSYFLSPNQLQVPAAGASGTLTASSACPVVVSSNQSWVTATPVGTMVQYRIAPNNGTSQRSAALTVGTVPVSIVQAGYTPPPALQLAVGHIGNFWLGESGAIYKVSVSNQSSAGPASGQVTVTESLPADLALQGMSGTNWNCPNGGPSCMRSDVLPAGGSYDPIFVAVNVTATMPESVTNQVMVGGGGSSAANASDATTIVAFSACDVDRSGATAVSDVQSVINQTLGIAPAGADLNRDGLVNVADLQIVISAALGSGCAGQ